MCNKIALFVMVKNEDQFISKFLDHNLPIFDSAIVVDNGSSDNTLSILEKYESKFCKIIKQPGAFNKSETCTTLMRDSDCDLLFPLDADELIVYDDGESVSKEQYKIREYLQNLPIPKRGARFKVRRILQKHPDFDDWWGIFNLPKVFYTKKGFASTDAGNHHGSMEEGFVEINSNISMLDYRYFCKDYWEKRTIEKLKSRFEEKWNDIDRLINYRGADMHAAIEYASYLGFKKCLGCKETKPSENFGLGRVMCKDCRPNLKDRHKEGKGVWHRLKKEIQIKI